jgi:hypothetical protein
MADPDARSIKMLLTAVRAWLWRHSSQPNGDPWDSDPEHLDRAAQNLVDELAHWLISTPPQSASRLHPLLARDTHPTSRSRLYEDIPLHL